MKRVYIPASLALFVAQAGKIAITEVKAFFEASPQKIFWPAELRNVCVGQRRAWKIPGGMNFSSILDILTRETQLRELKLECAAYPSLTRYTWGDVSPFLLALSTNRRTYLSHGSALWIHGLGGNPRLFYVNHEQREKPPNDNRLTQEAVDRALRNRPRQTNLVYIVSGIKIALLSGKFTSQLGVEKRPSPTGEAVAVTNIERTLIDAAVRPHYVGGVPAVINAFTAARGKVSIRNLVQTLNKLDYTYPYHQAIGFYLKQSGYHKDDQILLKGIGLDLQFYLSYGLKAPRFDAEWRIWYPRDLSSPGDLNA